MKVAIAGASGLVGSALGKYLTDQGHEVSKLVRSKPVADDEIFWQPSKGELNAKALSSYDVLVNLNGAGIGDKRWTEKYKDLMRSSRVDPTALLASKCAELKNPPKLFLSMSAIGFYERSPETEMTEQSPNGDTFIAKLVSDWERAAQPAVDCGIRTVFLRTGIVLTKKGGALGKMLPLFKLGLGGRFGSGKQWMSWITIDDFNSAISHIISSNTSGPVNFTSPTPCTNKDFSAALGKALKRPTLFPVPAFGPRLIFGSQRANALLFDSQRVLPAKLQATGFEFAHTNIVDALAHVTQK